jgi:hypothetical protein
MTIAEVTRTRKPRKPNPLLQQAQQHTEQARTLKRIARRQQAAERVRAKQTQLAKAVQQQTALNQNQSGKRAHE